MDLKEALKYLVDMGESQLKIERVMLPERSRYIPTHAWKGWTSISLWQRVCV